MAEITPELPKTQEAEVPEGVRQARAAFLRDFPALIADRKTRGRYVVYHKDRRVGVTAQYLFAVDEVNRADIPEGEYLIIRVTPAADRAQLEIADEAEIDPA